MILEGLPETDDQMLSLANKFIPESLKGFKNWKIAIIMASMLSTFSRKIILANSAK